MMPGGENDGMTGADEPCGRVEPANGIADALGNSEVERDSHKQRGRPPIRRTGAPESPLIQGYSAPLPEHVTKSMSLAQRLKISVLP